jgi:hypothetical protein
MNENTKTISLIAAAAAVLLLAFATRPAAPSAVTEDIVGKSLFPELDDPLKATRMRIVTFDDTAGKANEFEVAKVNGVWSLPSHKNYPADAKEQMAAAATALVDLKVLSPVSKDVSDHVLYGVVEPKPDEDQLGQKGIGKLVEVQGEGGKPLAKIIIGKADKPSKPDEMGMEPQAQIRYVRKPGQDQVYKVQMKADKFSSKFADWIETDLLKLSPWDITDIQLHDYSVINSVTRSGEVRPMIDRHADAELTFDDKTQKWTLKEMTDYKDGQSKPVKLAEGEDVNTVKLNDLKNALGSLKIIDVARKPAHMSDNLKADKNFMDDIEMMQDLARRGFLPAQVGDEFDIASSDGEAIVRMKDGVEYVLRFGKVAGIESPTDDEKKDDDKAADAKDDAKAKGGVKGKADDEKSADKTAGDKSGDKSSDKKDAGGLSRYLMVMARYNPDVIPKPELAPLPEMKKAPEKPAADSKAGTKAGEKAADKKGDAKSDVKSADAKAADKKGPAAKADAKDAKKDDAKKDDAKKDAGKGSEAKSTDEKSADSKAADASAEDDVEAQELERDRVEKENRRKQEAYDEQVKKAQQHAKELNSRFADWYYVVGNDTYGKIHLGKDDIVKKKAATPAADDPNGPHDPFQLQGLPGGVLSPAAGGKK